MNITLRSGTMLVRPYLQHGDSRNNLNIVEAPVGNVLIRTGGRRSGRGRNGVRQGAEDQSGGGVSRGVGISLGRY